MTRFPVLAAATAASALAASLAATPAAASVQLVTFEGLASGVGTPLTSGIATFSSNDATAFSVTPTGGLFSGLTGNALISTVDGAGLTISFSAPVTSISLNFSVTDLKSAGGGDTITIDGTTFTAGLIGSELFPEGSVLFSAGAPFTSVTITGPYAFGIDNLSISTVPEPASMAVLAVGLIGLGAARRRRAG